MRARDASKYIAHSDEGVKRTRMTGSAMMSREMGQINSLGHLASSRRPMRHSSSSSISQDWNAAAPVLATLNAEGVGGTPLAACSSGVAIYSTNSAVT